MVVVTNTVIAISGDGMVVVLKSMVKYETG